MTWLVFYSLIDWVSFNCKQANPEKFQAIAVGKKKIKYIQSVNITREEVVNGCIYRF